VGKLLRIDKVIFPAGILIVAVLVFGGGTVCAAEEDAEYERGLALRAEGNYSKAVEVFNRALENSPGHSAALVQKGAALEDLGKWKDAARAYSQAIDIDPWNASAVRNLEQLSAARALDTPLGGSNPVKEQMIRDGLKALHAGDFARAGEAFRLARAFFPDDPRPAFYTAAVPEKQGDLRGAVGLYRTVVQSFPDYVPARIHLVACLFSLGELDGAKQEARRASEALPTVRELQCLARLVSKPPQGASTPGSLSRSPEP
jgi:tetratricopeptide (TPR) repeat protein